MTALWIAACIASLAIGMLIGYADSARHLRRLPRTRWQPSRVIPPAPNQGLLADALREAA